MPVETIPWALSSVAEMRRLFSPDAIRLRASDQPIPEGPLSTEEVQGIQDCIDEATDECYMRIQSWYDIGAEATSNNLWLRRRATTGACYFLSGRRGNPEQYVERWQRALEQLDRVGSGDLRIPRLPMKADLSPGMSNVAVDDRYVIAKVRVEAQISTGGSQPNRMIDRRYLYYDAWLW